MSRVFKDLRFKLDGQSRGCYDVVALGDLISGVWISRIGNQRGTGREDLRCIYDVQDELARR